MNLPDSPSNPRRMNALVRRLVRSYRSADWIPQPSWTRTALAAGAALLLTACPFPRGKNPAFAVPEKNPFGLDQFDVPSAPAFADIDVDGDFDMFAGGGGEDSGRIAWFENTGTKRAPAFVAAADYPGLPNGAAMSNGYKIPLFAPLFGAGQYDMLIGHSAGGAPWWEAYENDGGSFTEVTPVPAELPDINWVLGEARGAGLGDLDADGLVDAVVSVTDFVDPDYVNTMSLYLNTGTASAPVFTDQSDDLGLVMPSSSYAYPTFADLDADGDLDALVGDEDGDLWYFENTGTATAATFAAPLQNPFGIDAVAGDMAVPTLVDIDHDGDYDLFVGDSNGDFWFYENTDL
jgi:large repetitive protein